MSDPSAQVSLGLLASEQPLALAYDLAILDLDGVVYVGPKAIPGTAEAVAAVRQMGMRCCYLTNNASRTPASVAEHLVELGLPASGDDVVTSAQVAASLLAKQLPAGAPVLVIGGAGLVETLTERHLVPITSFDDPIGPPQAVVQGFSPDLTWRQLAEAARAVRAGIPWTATNLDLTFPTEHGPAPGNGSLIRAVATAAGRDPMQVAGKPDRAPFLDAAARYGARRPLVVGDRLDTDIEGAVNAAMHGLAVLTGVSGPRELFHASAGMRPTYLSYDLHGLTQAHPAVSIEESRATCRESCVELQHTGTDRAELRVVTAGRPIDVLRAGCALTWSASDHGTTVDTAPIEALLNSITAAEWDQTNAIA